MDHSLSVGMGVSANNVTSTFKKTSFHIMLDIDTKSELFDEQILAFLIFEKLLSLAYMSNTVPVSLKQIIQRMNNKKSLTLS